VELKIEVTLEDIKYGIACNGAMCPVARALARAVPDAGVNVGHEFVELRVPGLRMGIVPLPREAREFIGRYDDGGSVEPFTFEVAL
jgi:hypothetical protein